MWVNPVSHEVCGFIRRPLWVQHYICFSVISHLAAGVGPARVRGPCSTCSTRLPCPWQHASWAQHDLSGSLPHERGIHALCRAGPPVTVDRVIRCGQVTHRKRGGVFKREMTSTGLRWGHRPWEETRQRNERSKCCSEHHRHVLLISQKIQCFSRAFKILTTSGAQ